MNSADFLNIVLALGFIILISCIAIVSFFLVKALKSIASLADNLEETTKDVQVFKNKIKMGILTGISALLTTFIGGIIKRRR